MNHQEIKQEKQGKEGGFYVVEAVDVSSESEIEEIDDISEIQDVKVNEQQIEDLDKLIAATRKEEIQRPKEDK